MTRIIWISVFLLIFPISSFSQSANIIIDVKEKPLNEVLIILRDHYDFQFSFSDNQLSRYKVTISKTFSKKEDALDFLLKGLPLELRKTGEVFIIVPLKEAAPVEVKKEVVKISGQILEAGSHEPLPFSHIRINNHPMVTDVMGSFNYTASTDSTFHFQASHLGYYIFDTILNANTNRLFLLTPFTENIPEILVKNNPIEKATLIGEKQGKIKLNHNISRYLPGQGDNSVFNLIRLMPGILASGELSTDLLIWGSYEGHSQVLFDEFTLFGLKNYNDNISVINPLIVKNIEIYKGGFDAKYGNRVGGLINISGKNGNLQKSVFTFNINQTTANGLLEIPLFKNRSSLMLAYRQTYYNLYNSNNFNIFAPTRPTGKNSSMPNRFNIDYNVYPDRYSFRDFNLKYSINLKGGDMLYLSLYGGNDKFSLVTDAEISKNYNSNPQGKQKVPFQVSVINNEENQQRGGSLFYSKKWKNGNSSMFTFTHSLFTKKTSDELDTENKLSGKTYHNDLASFDNSALENSLRNETTIYLRNGNYLETGGGVYINEAKISNISIMLRDSILIDTTNTFQNSRLHLFLHDNLHVGENLELKTGLRMNYMFYEKRFLLEPRISVSYKIGENIKLNGSWGLYNQFIYKLANVDKDMNYTYFWVASNKNIPVLRASHLVGGISYFKNNFTVNVEGYYKVTRNFTRRVYETVNVNNQIIGRYFPYSGDAKSYGMDVFLKKDLGKYSVWASYSLSKSLERLLISGDRLPEYTPAPHDQLHEVKIAGLFNIKNFYFSANYVYGSGMEILKRVFEDQRQNISYSRFDIAATYHFNPWGKTAEIGFSLLNLFDTQNLKYANLKRINLTKELGAITVYSNAVPFTPTLFLKIIL